VRVDYLCTDKFYSTRDEISSGRGEFAVQNRGQVEENPRH
jgi:hypothetical protein